MRCQILIRQSNKTMSTTFKTPVKSRRGLSFFVGFIGAYLVPIGLNNLLVAFGLRETLSATNTEYIAYGVFKIK